MQQTVSEITSVENQIKVFFHNHSLGKLLRQCGIRKEKGISLEALFQFLLALAFTGKNLFRHMEPTGSFDGIFKDVVYRFQNSTKANWRRFLLLLSTRIIVTRLESLTDESNRKVLIVDDTLFLRDRSKHVELLARVLIQFGNPYRQRSYSYETETQGVGWHFSPRTQRLLMKRS